MPPNAQLPAAIQATITSRVNAALYEMGPWPSQGATKGAPLKDRYQWLKDYLETTLADFYLDTRSTPA